MFGEFDESLLKSQSIERVRRCSALIICFRACGILSSIGMAWQRVDGFNTCVVEFVVLFCVGNEQDLVI